MLALIYLIVMVMLGDSVCRRFYSFVSLPYRIAGAFLSGLLISTWLTYLGAMLFARTSHPLLWSNLLFFAVATGFILWMKQSLPKEQSLKTVSTTFEANKWDWVLIGLFLVFAGGLIFSNFDRTAAEVQIANQQSNDFISNSSIIQRLATDYNFPPDKPFYASGLARPYFLFWFQAGNLEYLRLNPAWSINLLSVLTSVALLISILGLGEVLFGFRINDRIASEKFSSLGSQQFLKYELPSLGENQGLGKFLYRYRVTLLLSAATLILYALYVNNLTTNPPGFYLDESSMSYNAYQIYLTGHGEFGPYLPLYFPIFRLPPPNDYLGYADPVQIYVLAALHFVFPPSNLLSRLLSATAMFLAALLLGRLAMRMSYQWRVGIIVALTAILTPWLFEVSRLAFSVALYPLALVLFLSMLYRTYLKERWSLSDSAILAVTLALLTYTYSIGRLLGPLLALGLIFFATDVKRLKNVIKTWIAYGLTLLPMLVFHIRNPKALAGRFSMTVGYISPEKSFWEIAAEFVKHYAENISPRRLLFIGDPNLRHHITDTAPILAATLVLAIAGIFIVAARYRKDSWWRFILYGLIVSVVPASLTRDPFHMLRLIAFPIFLLILTVPTLVWLFNDARNEPVQGETRLNAARPSIFRQFINFFNQAWLWFQNVATPVMRRRALVVLSILTIVQAVFFQIAFRELGPKRGLWFDDSYPRVFAAALANPTRPIYLVDGYWGQAYLHGYWYAIVQGIDLSNFVHLTDGARPPAGSFVLSSEDKCSTCEMILKDDTYIFYKELTPEQAAALANANPNSTPETTAAPDANVFKGGKGNQPGQFEFPHGVAVDNVGNIFVADTGNGRIQKFSAKGDYLATFGQGICKSPKGIAVDADNIYVSDIVTNRILKFKAEDFSLLQEWTEQNEGFYGPSDIAIGDDKNLYVADQGRARIVKFTANGEFLGAWGSKGAGDGEFDELTGIAVDEQQRVYVADARNARIQIFDANGKFLSKFQVAEWSFQQSGWQAPDVLYDKQTRHLYVSSSNTHEIIVFELDGKRLENLIPAPPDKLNGPTSLVIGKNRQLFVLNTISSHLSAIDLGKK